MKKCTRGKKATGAAAIATALLLVSACGQIYPSKEPINGPANGVKSDVSQVVVGFAQQQLQAPYFAAMQVQAEQIAKQQGFKLLFQAANKDPVIQMNQMQAMIAQGADVLVVNATSVKGQKEMMTQISSKIPVTYIDTSVPGVTNTSGPNYESRLESKYLDGSRGANSYRVETFRASSDAEQSIRCYFVYQSSFKNPNPVAGETRIEELGDERFLIKATQHTKAIYQGIMDQVVSRTGPVIDMYDIEGTREKRLISCRRTAGAPPGL